MLLHAEVARRLRVLGATEVCRGVCCEHPLNLPPRWHHVVGAVAPGVEAVGEDAAHALLPVHDALGKLAAQLGVERLDACDGDAILVRQRRDEQRRLVLAFRLEVGERRVEVLEFIFVIFRAG